MSNPFASVESDGHDLLVLGVKAVAALVDSLISDVSAAVPKVADDAINGAVIFVESKLSGTYAGIFKMIIGGAMAAEAPLIAAGDVKIQIVLAYLKTEADAFLAKYSQ